MYREFVAARTCCPPSSLPALVRRARAASCTTREVLRTDDAYPSLVRRPPFDAPEPHPLRCPPPGSPEDDVAEALYADDAPDDLPDPRECCIRLPDGRALFLDMRPGARLEQAAREHWWGYLRPGGSIHALARA